MKKKIQKFIKKYATRDNLLIMALLGILLMVIAIPVGKQEGVEEKGQAPPAEWARAASPS